MTERILRRPSNVRHRSERLSNYKGRTRVIRQQGEIMGGARLDRGATFDPAQDEANTPEALMRDADATLYRAKGGGE
jgi:hypothetical protein